MNAERLLSLLRRPLEPEAREPFLRDVSEVQRRVAALGAGTFDPAELQRRRLAASQSLQRRGADGTAARRSWVFANALVHDWVRAERRFDLGGVLRLAGALRGTEGEAPLRNGPISFSGYEAIPARAVDGMMAAMVDEVERRTVDSSAVAGAALAQQWIVSVHPFDDANGRTGRLVADWLLARDGYPPPTYENPLQAINTIVDPDAAAPIGVAQAARVLLDGIVRTVGLVGCGARSP